MLDLRSPDVKRYSRAADAHLVAARTLADAFTAKAASTLGHHAIYLAGYAVECVMKALYVSRNPRERRGEATAELKADVGHNLERLRHLLTTKGVGFPPRILEQLLRVRSKWSSEMRYDVRSRTWDETAALVQAARDVLEWATTG